MSLEHSPSREHSTEAHKSPVEPKLLSINDTTRVLGIGRSTVYEVLAKGTLESVRLGHRRLVVADSIAALVQSLRKDSD